MISEIIKSELEELQTEHERFKINNLESANWAFRKLHAIEEQRAEFKALAEQEMERIQTWLDSELEKLEIQEMFFNSLLTEYAMEERKKNPKFKISTPYGKIGFRKQQPKWNYREEEIINWAKQNEMTDLIRVKEELDKKQLKWYATQQGNCAVTVDGEIIPGVEIIEQEEALKIEVI